MKHLFFYLLMLSSTVGMTQPIDHENQVLQTVLTLFDGMREADSAKVRTVFMPDASMYTIMEKDGQPILRQGSLSRFLKAVGTPHEAVWDEPIWNYNIQIDRNLASIWTHYAFFAGKKFSHCGVDVFKLFKSPDGWKIYSLSDTRQTEGCDLPPEKDLIRKL